jgi:hypothetical protein
MGFCGNVLELVEKYKVLEDYPEFMRWNKFEEQPYVDVYIEKDIIPEIEKKNLILIDVVVGEVNGKQLGWLFMKKTSNVYG